MCKFRLLNADEIECRVGQCFPDKNNPTAVSILLYKDARCDMAILDETVGSLNWMRRHEFKDGKLYCTVSIWDKEKMQWIDKEDVGVESNTEAEKGQASDSFKRSCVNWGIGRELYTAPFIYIKADNGEEIKKTRFDVKEISYDDKRRVASLVIVDNKGKVRFSFQPLRERIIAYVSKMDEKTKKDYLNYFQITDLANLTDAKAQEIADFEKKKKKQ